MVNATLDMMDKIAIVVGCAMLSIVRCAMPIGSLLSSYKRTGDKSLFTKAFSSGAELTCREKLDSRAGSLLIIAGSLTVLWIVYGSLR